MIVQYAQPQSGFLCTSQGSLAGKFQHIMNQNYSGVFYSCKQPFYDGRGGITRSMQRF